MIVNHRRFTTGSEVLANAVAIRAKFYGQKQTAVVPLPPVAVLPPKVIERAPRPLWKLGTLHFDAHVIEYRLEAAGETCGRLTIQQIVSGVLSRHPAYCINDLKGSKRTHPLVDVRQLAMYEVRRQRPDLSFPVIGRWFGGRDHTTVMHAVRKIEAQRSAARGE